LWRRSSWGRRRRLTCTPMKEPRPSIYTAPGTPP
jgi:hypothetical protein